MGLPHESDYVLELPKNTKLKTGDSFGDKTIFPLVQQIVASRSYILTEGLEHWAIYGVTPYYKTGGVCIVMQCRAKANDIASEEVGVTVDLVPVYIMETTNDILNEKANAYLPLSLQEYAEKGELYRLINDSQCDTGLIENAIMKQLPDGTKRAYRVIKFLISHLYVSSDIPWEYIKTLDSETRLRLYGHHPRIPSYRLRVLFLHLLLNVHSTKAEQILKGGLLVLCFIDMLNRINQFQEKSTVNVVNWCDYHPLIANNKEFVNYYFPVKPIRTIKRLMLTENPDNLSMKFNLLNSKSNFDNLDDMDNDD